MARDVVIVTDPKVIRVGIEDTRLKILSLLKFNDLTVAQIAEVIGKDESTVYRHIEKLVHACYVEIAGERTIHHIPERIYKRTAKVFILSPDELPDAEGRDILKERRRDQLRAALRIVSQIGHKIEDKKSTEESLLKLFSEIDAMAVSDFKNVNDAALADPATFWRTRIILILLMMRDDAALAKRMDEALDGID